MSNRNTRQKPRLRSPSDDTIFYLCYWQKKRRNKCRFKWIYLQTDADDSFTKTNRTIDSLKSLNRQKSLNEGGEKSTILMHSTHTPIQTHAIHARESCIERVRNKTKETEW